MRDMTPNRRSLGRRPTAQPCIILPLFHLGFHTCFNAQPFSLNCLSGVATMRVLCLMRIHDPRDTA
jgi:hypothetical protein